MLLNYFKRDICIFSYKGNKFKKLTILEKYIYIYLQILPNPFLFLLNQYFVSYCCYYYYYLIIAIILYYCYHYYH